MDIIGFLDAYGISYRTTGPKTTKNWVQLEDCFSCYGSNFYLGIYTLQPQYFHCWACGASGSMEYLIRKILSVSRNQAQEIAKQFGMEFEGVDEEPILHAQRVEIAGMGELREPHVRYLKERLFDPSWLVKRYRVGGCWLTGRFPYRLVIPVLENGILVNATARDVTGEQQERYMSLRNDEAVVPIKETVYNLDAVNKGNILIVEGPFDVWRIGGATVCMFGTAFKMAQVVKVLAKVPKNAYVLFDNEETAQKSAEALAACLSPFVTHVEILEISAKDPASLSEQEAMEIRNELQL